MDDVGLRLRLIFFLLCGGGCLYGDASVALENCGPQEPIAVKTQAMELKASSGAELDVGKSMPVAEKKTEEEPPVTLSKEMRYYLSRQYNDPLLVNKTVTLSLRDASIGDALELIGKASGFNFLIDPDVRGQIQSLHFKNAPLAIVLRHLLQSNVPRLALVRDCELFRISRLRPAKEVLLVQQQEDFVATTIALSHLMLGERQKELIIKLWNGIFGDQAKKTGFYMLFDESSRKIFCRGKKEQIGQFKKFLKEIDCRSPQIKIEARFVCAEKGFEENVGVQWSGIYNRRASVKRGFHFIGGGAPLSDISNNPHMQSQESLVDWALNFLPTPDKAAQNIRVPIVFGGSDLNTKRLNLVLNAAENRNEIKTILKPTVLTNDGEPADILVGENIPIENFVEESSEGRVRNIRTALYRDIGIQLKVLPTAAPDRRSLFLDIFIENSQQNDSLKASDVSYPVIRTTRSHTKVQLLSGQTTQISGLIEDVKEEYKSRAPGIHAIPLIGPALSWLFAGKRKVTKDMQLLIYITATIV